MSDLSSMAREAHQKNMQRADGGPGSGPKGGGSGLPKKKSKVTIGQAAVALKKQGYELGAPTFNHQTQETTYSVTKGGKTEKLTTTQIKNKIF